MAKSIEQVVLPLQFNTEQNYHLAINYFVQKKAAFLSYLQSQSSNLQNENVKSIEKELQQEIENIIGLWGNANIQKDIQTGIDNAIASFKVAIPSSSLQQTNSSSNKEITFNISNGIDNTKLGQIYEQFWSKMVQKTGQNFVTNKLLSLLGLIHTGNMTGSGGGIRINNREIRPDLGNFAQEDVNKGQIELKAAVDLNKIQHLNDSQLLMQALENNKYGFSLKTWSDNLTDTHITGASGIRSKVENVLTEAMNNTNNHFINLWYGHWLMLNEISRWIMNILGPTNVLLITGSGMYWFCDLLENYYLRMKLYSDTYEDKRYEDHNKWVKNLKPYSNHIYLLQKQKFVSIKNLRTKLLTADNNSKYYGYELRVRKMH